MLDADATVAALVADAARTALLLDYDGSVAPIVEHPEEAVPLPGAIDVLACLARSLGRVAIVSGRPAPFLAAQLPVREMTLVGLYGMETIRDGLREIDPRVLPFLGQVAAAADTAELRLPDVYVERKSGVSVTLHWRTAPGRADDVLAVADELAREHGLRALRTRMAVELRPPVAVDKGTVVEALVDGAAVGAFAGDDTGDLPAFAALARAVDEGRLQRAVRIGVLSPEAPLDLHSSVDLIVDGPQGLLALLRRVCEEVA